MIATLQFNLPEESQEHKAAIEGMSYQSEIQEFDNFLRAVVKYEDYSKFPVTKKIEVEQVRMVITIVREQLHEFCQKSLGG